MLLRPVQFLEGRHGGLEQGKFWRKERNSIASITNPNIPQMRLLTKTN